AASLVQRQVNALGFIETLVLTVIERHVQSAEIPVHAERNRIVGLHGRGKRERRNEPKHHSTHSHDISSLMVLRFQAPTSAGCCETCHGMTKRSIISTM